MKNCPSCGHENLLDAHFCEACGCAFEIGKMEEGYVNESSTAFYCSNCGKAATEAVEYCPNCGSSLKKNKLSSILPVKSALTKKQKIGIIVGMSIVILLLIGFMGGKYYYSYPQQLSRLEQTFKTQDPQKIAEIVTSDDPNYHVSTANMKKFVSYYQKSENKKAFTSFLADLGHDPEQLKDFTIVQKGKYLGLFPKYQLSILPVYVTVTTDQSGMELLLDGKKLATSKGRNYQTTWGPLTPGNYQVEGKLDTEKSIVTQNLVRYQNSEFKSDSQLAINLHKVAFKVTSNIEGAKILVDNKEVGTIKNGKVEIKNLVWHQGMNVKAIYPTENEQLTSDSYKISETEFLADDYDSNSYLSEMNLDFEGIQSSGDVQHFLDRLYEEVSDYTSRYSIFGASQTSDLAGYFVDGLSNTDEKDFEKFINDIRTSGKKLRVDAETKVESITMTSKNIYQVQYLIYYDTVYTDDTADVNQVFRYKKALLRYDPTKATFQIDNLGGAENFETLDDGGN
ncbi:zinc ribbon domain-containing protein [Enterococcus hermanniensis]|uniref:Uncharacterized protein n=1 Tax=Enterococcus hermanniensis TaxID=249189 RepID=A0A1L8TL46_9ENTE|nr:zinc ribbon domain-containing protein [Enterococcus hermanniensis]OJG44933.1 hypothetical protein RV04_GL000501 [Enterococcus hermanniensis]